MSGEDALRGEIDKGSIHERQYGERPVNGAGRGSYAKLAALALRPHSDSGP